MTLQETLQSKLKAAKLKKIRSKMVLEAIEKGVSIRGNHKIELIATKNESVILAVYYRGTIIAKANIAYTGVLSGTGTAWQPIGAGEYERTPATIRQRKDLDIALDEISDVLCGAVS